MMYSFHICFQLHVTDSVDVVDLVVGVGVSVFQLHVTDSLESSTHPNPTPPFVFQLHVTDSTTMRQE